MSESQLHVVVGAAGATGRRVVAHLLEAGCRVRALTCDGRGIGHPEAELGAADAVIHHCAMPPIGRWQQDFPPLTDAVIAAAEASAARVVYADDTWMYGRVGEPMTPELHYRPVGPWGRCAPGWLSAWSMRRLRDVSASRSCEPASCTAQECAR